MKGKKLGWCSVISARLSIGYDIKDSYVNWKLLVSQAPPLDGLLTI